MRKVDRGRVRCGCGERMCVMRINRLKEVPAKVNVADIDIGGVFQWHGILHMRISGADSLSTHVNDIQAVEVESGSIVRFVDGEKVKHVDGEFVEWNGD